MDVSSLVPAGLQPGLDLCVVPAGYNKLSENLRKLTPIAIQCAIFCGGSRCKYENPKAWRPVHMAIQDIFSHWVTDHVLAMARPSTAQLIKKNVIEQFKGWSIKTIVNLQTPGEHSSCGGNLEESGFTYDPNHFMKNGIYFYNFAWKDYGDATMSKLLDMVKVVAFAVQEGRVAIHCHAGKLYRQQSVQATFTGGLLRYRKLEQSYYEEGEPKKMSYRFTRFPVDQCNSQHHKQYISRPLRSDKN